MTDQGPNARQLNFNIGEIVTLRTQTGIEARAQIIAIGPLALVLTPAPPEQPKIEVVPTIPPGLIHQ